MLWNNRTLVSFVLAVILAGTGFSAEAKGSCPARANDKVKKIDIFDGKPEELAFLAPDDHEKAPNTYTVADIYEAGRIVTLRCNYQSGVVIELPLKDKVKSCQVSRNKSGTAIACK